MPLPFISDNDEREKMKVETRTDWTAGWLVMWWYSNSNAIKVGHFYLHVNGLQSVHNAGIQLIHNLELTTCNNQDFKMFVGNLGQLLLPEFIGKLLADSDAVFVAWLQSFVQKKYYIQTSSHPRSPVNVCQIKVIFNPGQEDGRICLWSEFQWKSQFRIL